MSVASWLLGLGLASLISGALILAAADSLTGLALGAAGVSNPVAGFAWGLVAFGFIFLVLGVLVGVLEP